MNPTDVVRTRIYNQPKEGKGLYKNGYDAYVKIVRYEGFLALYKGIRQIYTRHLFFKLIYNIHSISKSIYFNTSKRIFDVIPSSRTSFHFDFCILRTNETISATTPQTKQK